MWSEMSDFALRKIYLWRFGTNRREKNQLTELIFLTNYPMTLLNPHTMKERDFEGFRTDAGKVFRVAKYQRDRGMLRQMTCLNNLRISPQKGERILRHLALGME